MNRSWHSTALHRRFADKVPAVPGIYKIFSIEDWYMKIPLGLEIHYVGKASKSIRNRFYDHTSHREHNSALAKLANEKKMLEFWYLELHPDEVDEAEVEAIKYYHMRSNNNLVNKILYKRR